MDGFLITWRIPPGVGTAHGKQVELDSLKHEPDRNGDGLPSLAANHAELDLTVSGKAFFKFLGRDCHSKGASFTACLNNNRRFRGTLNTMALPPEPHPGPITIDPNSIRSCRGLRFCCGVHPLKNPAHPY